MSRMRSTVGRFRSVYGAALGGVSASFALACGGGAEPESGVQRSLADLSGAASESASCDELLAQFKSSLLAEVSTIAEEARRNPYLPAPEVTASEPLPAPRSRRPSTAPAPQPESPAPSFSTTTQSVPGVEPADVIKADGDRIYLARDNSLVVLDASDASNLQVLAELPLGEGYPTELLVHQGRAVVFSIIYDGLPEVSGGLTSYFYPNYFVKLTIVDATGSEPTISHESYFEGSYAGAVRAGSVIRTFLPQSTVGFEYPPVSYIDIFGRPRDQEDIDRQVDLWVELTTETIEESTIDDYLPEQYERVGGQLRLVPTSCSSLVRPLGSASVIGSSSLVSVDLAAAEPSPTRLPLLGAYAQSASLHENAAVVYEQDYGSGPVFVPEDVRANLHLFEFDGVVGSYAGTASAPGYLYGPVGVDEATGVISGVFARDVFDEDLFVGSASRVHTFGWQQGGLVELGQSADLPGDYASALRIDGDRAYVSTYSSPSGQLLIVDLSDPGAPAVAGSVDLEPTSSVLVPFGQDQLLTFSQSVDLINYSSEYALQLLDVGDPTAPALGARIVLGRDVYSEAMYDARALTLHPEGGVFSLPVDSYLDGSSSLEVFQLSSDSLSQIGSITHDPPAPGLVECLALLGYPTDPEFVEELSEELSEILLQECSYYYYGVGSMRRGLFRGDEAYALSTSVLTGHSLGALAGPPLSKVELPLPGFNPLVVPVPIDVVPAAEGVPAEE